MIIGIFHPGLNSCGGAERVALKIIDTLRENGHQVKILTDSRINQAKFVRVFDRKVLVDQEIVFPLRLFGPNDFHNVYTDIIRSLVLKSKCEVLIDTSSNSILPGMNVSYIHYPMLKLVEADLPYLRNKVFFFPYRRFLDFSKRVINDKLFFANSRFTAKAVKAEFGVNSHVLYPPLSNDIISQNERELNQHRNDSVVTISRIARDKNLEIIPYIAKSTSKSTYFVVVGLLESEEVLSTLLRLVKKLKVSEKVKVIPNVGRPGLRKILLNSKVYLHTKVNEHFGISIIEAMSSGCIPIVHNSGGPKEFVPKHLRYESIEDAAQKINEAIERWSPRKACSTSKYAQRFSESNFSKQFIDIFNSHFHRDI
jgi:glycosyltransferase involved in cell wall biosynthesis